MLSIFEFAAAHDARPKTLIAAAHDQFRPAAGSSAVDAWRNTDVVVVEGHHFFHGAGAIVGTIGAVLPIGRRVAER